MSGFCAWSEVDPDSSSCTWRPCRPAPLVGEAALSPLTVLIPSLKNQLTMNVRVYFYIISPVPFISVSFLGESV